MEVDLDGEDVRMEAWVSPRFRDLSNQKNGVAIKLNVEGGRAGGG